MLRDVFALIGALGTPTIAGYFALRANRQRSTVTENTARAKAVKSDAVETLDVVRDLIIEDRRKGAQIVDLERALARCQATLESRPSPPRKDR